MRFSVWFLQSWLLAVFFTISAQAYVLDRASAHCDVLGKTVLTTLGRLSFSSIFTASLRAVSGTDN